MPFYSASLTMDMETGLLPSREDKLEVEKANKKS
jgi:hypothetical protein